MEAFKELCTQYPVIQITEVSVLLGCSIPSLLLLITVQRAPFHMNCRILITLWTIAQLLEYVTVALFAYDMLQYEDNYMARSYLFPDERKYFLIAQMIVATFANCLELGITLERAVSVRRSESYHNSRPARGVITIYLVVSVIFSTIIGWMMKEGADSLAALISVIIQNSLDITSFLSNIAVLFYCRRRYRNLFAKSTLNTRYQVREANYVAHVMLPAYISGLIIKITIAISAWLFTLGIEKAGLYFLSESMWVTLQLLNNGRGSAILLLMHERLRSRLIAMLFRRRQGSLVISENSKAARGEQYFEMLKTTWR